MKNVLYQYNIVHIAEARLDRVFLWPDGVWCYEEDLEEYLRPPYAKSDDYKMIESEEFDFETERRKTK